MLFTRGIYFRKSVALFLLIIFLNTFYPKPIFGFTDGPQQNEYTSYESPGQGDLVNLLTGDFTYNLPLMTVPGPEMSFPVNLFYHSGIGLEQEATWTGLGWNLNVGAITRDVAGYPDDAFDQVHSVNVQDPGGSGYVKNFVLYKRTWDSEKGYGGGISLFNIVGVDWTNSGGLKSGTILGQNFNKTGIKGYWAENVFSGAMAAGTVLSLGVSTGLIKLKEAASSATMSAGLGYLQAAVSVGSNLLQGYNSQGVFSSSVNRWSREIETSNLGFRTDYRYWLDDTRDEHAFGTLYLGSTDQASFNNACSGCESGYRYPRISNSPPETGSRPMSNFKQGFAASQEATSDMYRYVDPEDEYIDVHTPTHLTHDYFSVMGSGVSGVIQPFRSDVGSVGFTKRMNNISSRWQPVRYLEEGAELDKVQFIYPGEVSNRYLFHDVNETGISHEIDFGANGGQGQLYLSLDDNKIKPGNTVEADRNGLESGKLIKGKNIKWFSNEEITNGTASNDGFIDTSDFDRTSRPLKGIGAFQITKEDGVTYHYSLPVYSRSERNFSGKKGEETTKFALHQNTSEVAQTWLLTAITGPDYNDMNANGVVDENDIGQWVGFNYGRYSSWFSWRSPYVNYFDDGERLSFSKGLKELYYLDEIKTRSHTAVFIKGIRKDGRGAYYKGTDPVPPSEGGYTTHPRSTLYLDRIVLLSNEKYDLLRNSGFPAGPFEQTNDTDEIDHNAEWLHRIYDVFDAQRNSSIIDILENQSIQTIQLNYETDVNKQLCFGATNSFSRADTPPSTDEADIYLNRLGKLTLNSVSTFGENQVKVMPDYKFGYGYNPNYHKDSWGGWGMYNRNGQSQSHIASTYDDDGAAWSMNKITLPLGGVLDIEYERDTYASVSGNTITEKKGGNIRVSKLSFSDGDKSYDTRYIYTKNSLPTGESSGVVSKEPEFIKRRATFGLDPLYDLPSTSVLYSKVTILNGELNTDQDFHTKLVYEFETPDMTIVTQTRDIEAAYRIPGWGSAFSDHVYYRQHFNKVHIRNARIGSIKGIYEYDANDILKNSTVFNYVEDLPNDQGKFSQGTITAEFAQKTGNDPAAFKFQRTSKIYYPYILKSITSTDPYGTSVKTTATWDFITGIEKASILEGPMGIRTRAEKVFAYEKYPEMGPIHNEVDNKNMLSQIAGNYTYKLNGSNAYTGLIGATAATWNKDWNTYRELDASGEYVDIDNTYPTWRKSMSYVYQGDASDLKTDGTLTFVEATDKFDWATGASNPNWQYAGELLRFDNYSMPLESKDLNNIYTVTKTDVEQKRKVLEAANAKYTEVAWSGAENGYITSNGKTYVDGEVRIGSPGQVDVDIAHTGKYCLQLTGSNEKGFHYVMKAGEYDPDRNYRLGVWVFNPPSNIQLYYQLGTTLTPLTASIIQSGNWYRMEALIPASVLNGTQTLEVGCITTSGADVYIDDFRFQPIDAGLTAYVYNDRDELTYTLDNENFFTEYQYNDQGRLVRTYVETSAHGRVQLSETTQHFKRDGE